MTIELPCTTINTEKEKRNERQRAPLLQTVHKYRKWANGYEGEREREIPCLVFSIDFPCNLSQCVTVCSAHRYIIQLAGGDQMRNLARRCFKFQFCNVCFNKRPTR